MATMAELLLAMKGKVGFEAVQQSEEPNRLFLYGRIRGQTIANMLLFAHRLLLSARTSQWNSDVSQAYSLKNGQLVKGWRLIVNAEDMPLAIDQVIAVLRASPQAKQRELDEFPLSGGPDRNAPNAKGKGAALTGQAIIGRR